MKNGGPAFPTTDFTHAGQIIPGSEGMSLRDYFAAKAMQAWLTGWAIAPPGSYELAPTTMAENAYKAADAMLKAREA